MLKYQSKQQLARELARSYLSSTGTQCTPAQYLEKLEELEKEFLELLNG